MAEQLTDDEYSVLMIVAEGGTIGPIGHWEKPVKALHMRGLLYQHNAWNYGKTEAGEKALAEREKEYDAQLGQILTGANALAVAASEARVAAEESAKHLANAIRVSAKAAGQTREAVARQWSAAIIARALELV